MLLCWKFELCPMGTWHISPFKNDCDLGFFHQMSFQCSKNKTSLQFDQPLKLIFSLNSAFMQLGDTGNGQCLQLIYLTKISLFSLLSVDLKKGSCPSAAKSNLPKPCPSGLRPPGYSRLPAAKLAAFGFVRSSSVSSVSSNQSNDSAQSDQSRTTNREFPKEPLLLEGY